jgi:multidrug efflux pump
MTITLYFEQGTNPDIAQVQVQNKLQLATPLLPTEGKQAQGMRVAKATRNFLMVIGFYSSRRLDEQRRHQRLRRIARTGSDEPHAGVGDYQLFGSPIRHAHLARFSEAGQLRR